MVIRGKNKNHIIDDEPEAINRLRRLLNHFDNIEIVDTETDPQFGILKVIENKPDLVFLDVEMPGKSGFEVIEEVSAAGFKPKYIITTGYEQYMLKAIRAQAFDYLIKPVDIDELKDLIIRFSKEHRSAREQLETTLQQLADTNGLTEREKEILPYMINGQTSDRIAAALYISKNTVDTHRRKILHKLRVKSTAELIAKLSSGQI